MRKPFVVPPAPQPVKVPQMGIVFALFKDGSIWLQVGPEKWRFVRKVEVQA